MPTKNTLKLLILLVFLFTLQNANSQPQIRFEPDTVDFGRTPIGWLNDNELNISNPGDQRLIITVGEIEDNSFGHNFYELFAEEVHFEFEITEINHSILITEVLWDDQNLAFGCEIGLIDPRGDCAGAELVAYDEEMMGIAAWGGNEEEEVPGFLDGEEFIFMYYDPGTDVEVEADFEILEGNETWSGNGFTLVTLSADEGDHRGPGEIFIEAEQELQLILSFQPEEVEEYQSVFTILSNDDENEEIGIQLRGEGIVNNRPRWAEVPLGVEANEGELIEFDVIAEDPNEDVLEISIGDHNLPEGYELADIENGVAMFSWRPSYEDGGEYAVEFIVFDGFVSADTTVLMLIHDVVPPMELPNAVLVEDHDAEDLFDLDDHFEDPEGQELNYSIILDHEEIELNIDENNVISAQPIENFWIGDEGLEFRVQSENPGGDTQDGMFFITVLPTYDSLSVFNLLAPQNQSEVNYHNIDDYRFEWESAQANEWEDSEILYNLRFQSFEGEELNYNSAENFIIINVNDWVEWLNLTEDSGEFEIDWSVEADDDSSQIWADNGPFSLNFHYFVSVQEDYLRPIPIRLELLSNYPNPFNSSTTIAFGLPSVSSTSLKLFNSNGALQRVLLPGGSLNQGWHEFSFDAGSLPAGNYFLVLNNNLETRAIRISLVK